jgi:hypothetical protein
MFNIFKEFFRPTVDSIIAPVVRAAGELENLIGANSLAQGANRDTIRALVAENDKMEAENERAARIANKINQLTQ